MQILEKIIKFLLFILFTSIVQLSAQTNIRELDRTAAFSFSVMSDNKGYSIENPHMAKCDNWIRDAGDRFILGLGDHVKDNRANPFLSLMTDDSLWHNHFYPNVADGENEFWGEEQADLFAGAAILEYVDLSSRKNVKIRNNKSEYYAIEEYEGIKVHIIQLHYSDTPTDPVIAFNESSRKYLMDTLDSIHKTDNDIIVILAHTHFWVEKLSEERKLKILKKADLVLDANTHTYNKYNYLGDGGDSGALAINTGAIGNSSDSGFIQVHVFKHPTRMVVQYQRTKNDSRELQETGFAFEKIINGRITEIDWKSFKL
ncbi:MAG: hypothetical protein DWQ05_11280 [Calditrichaeota bacterium]|nr:MAG: hypothetical protein DWQ05_11280 [Calditrichota bacterium]